VWCTEPPHIDAFSFPQRKLYDRVSVSCVVSSGDLPINIAWTKDNADIPHQLGVVVQVRFITVRGSDDSIVFSVVAKFVFFVSLLPSLP